MNQNILSVEALGKCIISGEHIILYGYPALAMSIPLKLKLHLRDLSSEEQKKSFQGFHFLQDIFWDIKGYKVTSNTLKQAFQRALLFHHKKSFPYKIMIESQIPLGAGLGSSAALCVAICKLLEKLYGKTLESLELKARTLESYFHRPSSGLDIAASLSIDPIVFQKEQPLQKIPPPKGSCWLAIDSGERASTSSQVQKVKKLYTQDPQKIDSQFQVIGKNTSALINSWKEFDWKSVGEKMNSIFSELEELGLSTPTLSQMQRTSLELGALGAKITGAGGGGVLIILMEYSKVLKIRNYFQDKVIFQLNYN
jgi:mevalonate kinase